MHLRNTQVFERNFNDKHSNKKGQRQSIEKVNLRKGALEYK